VYLAFDDGEYSAGAGTWRPMDPTPLEEFPRSTSAREVVSWGRRRAPRLLIPPEADPGQYYWAGAEPPSGRFAELPGSRSERSARNALPPPRAAE
jgi:hypothetical protein